MRVGAVVFDLDGTLADSIGDIGGAVNDVLHARGLPAHPLSAYLEFVGEGAERLIERALPAHKQALLPEVLAEYRVAYANRLTRDTRLYPGIPELLDRLVARGLLLAILSNKPDAPTKRLHEALLARWPFPVVYGERAGIPRKPDPTSALEIARALGVPPAECLFVGDTPIDMKTALAAGMYGVGVLWGFRPQDELEQSGARVVLSHATELLDVIDVLATR